MLQWFSFSKYAEVAMCQFPLATKKEEKMPVFSLLPAVHNPLEVPLAALTQLNNSRSLHLPGTQRPRFSSPPRPPPLADRCYAGGPPRGPGSTVFPPGANKDAWKRAEVCSHSRPHSLIPLAAVWCLGLRGSLRPQSLWRCPRRSPALVAKGSGKEDIHTFLELQTVWRVSKRRAHLSSEIVRVYLR